MLENMLWGLYIQFHAAVCGPLAVPVQRAIVGWLNALIGCVWAESCCLSTPDSQITEGVFFTALMPFMTK